MAVDLSVYGKVSTLADQLRLQGEQEFNRRLVQSQIAKNEQLDVDKLGEVAFMKAAQGIALTPQEHAAARYVDAKSGGIMFNPASGAIEQKPRISDKIGLDELAPQGQGSTASPPRMGMPAAGAPRTQPPMLPAAQQGADASGAADFFQQQYEASMQAAAGNPKAQQAIKEDYLKSRMKFTESQSKDAGFADRMANTNPEIDDNQAESNTLWNYMKSSVPIVGNYMVSPEYQKFDRAQSDFINAQLRDESGAVIGPSEFIKARKQYMPAPGDSEAVLAEKAQAREIARQNMTRAAGPAYKAPNNYERGKAEFEAKKKGGSSGKVINWEDLK